MQVPNADDLDARALALAVAYPQVAGALASIDLDSPRRVSTVRLAVSGQDFTTLAIRAGDLVRLVVDRFHVHRQQLAETPAHAVS